MNSNKDQFYSWLQTLLKDKNWQISRSGTKVQTLLDKHQVSSETGYWVNPPYSSSKPPRWIINFTIVDSLLVASVPTGHRSERIGQGNTAQANVVGISVRIIPVFNLQNGQFHYQEDWEWNLLFLMPYPVPVGSSSETFDFNPANGRLEYKGETLEYIFAALIGGQDPEQIAILAGSNVTYSDATDALKRLLKIKTIAQELSEIPTYDLYTQNTNDLAEIKRAIIDAMAAAPTPAASLSGGSDDDSSADGGEPSEILPEIVENRDLLGIDPAVYRQINAALKSGKQHLMLYGPPGTGKTTLARWIATQLAGSNWNLITGSADWSSQDIIGGYQPIGDGFVTFIPGILLKTFDYPLIIDELNRCDIDKVLGPLFTVLSGHFTTLPYRTDVEDPNSPAYVVLPLPKSLTESHEFAPGVRWRLIATINSIDKAALYQMSYALSRRFGWIYVDAPQDKKKFLARFLNDAFGVSVSESEEAPIAVIWDEINKIRVLGPAPFIDMVKAIRAMDSEAIFFESPSDIMQAYLLDAFDMLILPLLDGISRYDAEKLTTELIRLLNLTGELQNRLKERLLSVSI